MFENEGLKMHENRLYGPFRAIVKNNRDPLGLNRITVICPSVYGVDENDVPIESGWAYPMTTFGICNVPPVTVGGNPVVVWLFLEMGDSDYPLWSGSPYGYNKKEESEVPKKFSQRKNGSKRERLDNFLLYTPSGHYIELDDDKDFPEIRLISSTGDSIVIGGKENKISITSKKEVVVTSPTVTIKSSTKVSVEAPVVEVKGNLSVTGNISATGSVMDVSGNSNHHSHP